MNKLNLIDHTGKQAALLSLIEIGLGSILHSLRLPFSGHSLSLNQSFLLSRAALSVRQAPGARFVPAYMSNIAAILKSLAPAGKKLTPMLAISAQGSLFTLGLIVFGINPVGIVTGSILLSLWAFIQPVLLYYLLYGKTIIHIADYFYEKLDKVFPLNSDILIAVLLSVVLVKVCLSIVVAFLALRLPDDFVESQYKRIIQKAKAAPKYNHFLKQSPHRQSIPSNMRLAFFDLCNPLFLFSLVVTCFFFIFTKTEITQTIWILLRPIAVGYVLFLCIRLLPIERLFADDPRKFSQSMRSALRHLKEF